MWSNIKVCSGFSAVLLYLKSSRLSCWKMQCYTGHALVPTNTDWSNIGSMTGRKDRGPQVVALSILCWQHLVLPWANQCIFLMERFFLNYVNETMYLFWNLPFCKMVPPKTNFFSLLTPWAVNSLTNQYSCQFFYGRGYTPCAILSQNAYCGRGPGETPSALRCLSYLINSFLTDIKHLAKN